MGETWESLTRNRIPTCSNDINGVLKKIAGNGKILFYNKKEEAPLKELAMQIWELSGENPDIVIEAFNLAIKKRSNIEYLLSAVRNNNKELKSAVKSSQSPRIKMANEYSEKHGEADNEASPQNSHAIGTDQEVEGETMGSRYRKISPTIWNDSKFMSLSNEGKLVFLFLLTHPFITMLGAMRGSIPGLAAELGWLPEAFRDAFNEALSKDMVKHDEKASFIWLPKFQKYNPPESPNAVKSWGSALELVPECTLKDELIQQVKDYALGLTQGFMLVLPEVFRYDQAIQKQEQKQEQKQYKPSISPLLLIEEWNKKRGPLQEVVVGLNPDLLEKLCEVFNKMGGLDKWSEFVTRMATKTHPTNYWFMSPTWLAKDIDRINKVLGGTYERNFKDNGDQAAESRKRRNRGSIEGHTTENGKGVGGKPKLTVKIEPSLRWLQRHGGNMESGTNGGSSVPVCPEPESGIDNQENSTGDIPESSKA